MSWIVITYSVSLAVKLETITHITLILLVHSLLKVVQSRNKFLSLPIMMDILRYLSYRFILIESTAWNIIIVTFIYWRRYMLVWQR